MHSGWASFKTWCFPYDKKVACSITVLVKKEVQNSPLINQKVFSDGNVTIRIHLLMMQHKNPVHALCSSMQPNQEMMFFYGFVVPLCTHVMSYSIIWK